MLALWHLLCSNILVAAVLAVLAAGLSALCRRPALTHGLWLLVLLKMLAPPLWGVPLRWAARDARPKQQEAPPAAVAEEADVAVEVVPDVSEAVEFLTADLTGPFARVAVCEDRVEDRRNCVFVDLLPAGGVLKQGCKVPFPNPKASTDKLQIANLEELISLKLDSWANSPSNYDYAWLRCDKSGGACAALTPPLPRRLRAWQRSLGFYAAAVIASTRPSSVRQAAS